MRNAFPKKDSRRDDAHQFFIGQFGGRCGAVMVLTARGGLQTAAGGALAISIPREKRAGSKRRGRFIRL
jgi:hypothetical protein